MARRIELTINISGFDYGPLAQWLEQATHNRLVGGSSPSRPTNLRKNNVKLTTDNKSNIWI